MPGLVLAVLFGLNCLLFPCEGQISLPPRGDTFVVLPGENVTIAWKLDVSLSDVSLRLWIFLPKSDSYFAEIIRDGNVDEQPKHSPGRFTIKKNATFILNNVTIQYNGTYRFSIFSKGKSTESDVYVFVAVKPNVTFSCSNPYTINEGDNSTCVCRGEDGNPPANVTWYDKNGVQIGRTGKEEQTLPLSNVSGTDRGSYRCRAQSHTLADNKSIEVKIRLNFKPSNTNITFTPKRAVVGESITITCISEGLPEPSYSIIHNGTEVSANKTYTIDDIQYRHAGIYTCVAMNKLGNDSASANLTIIVKPYNTKITITPDETEVGKSVIITCHSEGRPEPRYNITHNRIVLSTGKPYHIFKAKVSDAGTYECITWNELGLNDSAFAYLTVEVKPNTKITFEPESAVIGSPCIITCDSSGFPAPNHTITHNGTEVTTNKTYTIDVVKWSDAGIYKCVAKNVLGNYSASANLTVTEPPSPTTRPPTEPLSTSKESDTTTSPDISSSNDASSGIEWYIIAVILVSGIIIVILLSYIVWCSRRRWVRNRKPEQNPEAQTTEADTTYQALDLTKMNTEDDYQSLRNTKPQSNPEPQRTEVDTTYQALDLSKMNTEDNYQSLRNRGPELNPETKTTEADTTYQELDLSKMNTEDNYQSLRVNAASNEAVDDDESTYTELSKTRDEENKYQSLK